MKSQINAKHPRRRRRRRITEDLLGPLAKKQKTQTLILSRSTLARPKPLSTPTNPTATTSEPRRAFEPRPKPPRESNPAKIPSQTEVRERDREREIKVKDRKREGEGRRRDKLREMTEKLTKDLREQKKKKKVKRKKGRKKKVS